jgi:hypothetical protein
MAWVYCSLCMFTIYACAAALALSVSLTLLVLDRIE